MGKHGIIYINRKHAKDDPVNGEHAKDDPDDSLFYIWRYISRMVVFEEIVHIGKRRSP